MKRTGEITFRDKKWVASGKKLPKPYFCSRECGQHYSGVTYNSCRDIKVIAKSLRTREAFKYAELAAWLTKRKVKHRFEHPIGDYVFDLALKIGSEKILVEFDGRHHDVPTLAEIDVRKDKIARASGWKVYRVHQPEANRIPMAFVKSLVSL